eukprot:EG_transcript_17085
MTPCHSLNKDQLAAGLSCLGRTGYGIATAFLKIDLSNLSLDDVELLQNYPALQEIDLSNNKLTNLGPLHSLPHLLKLNLARNGLSCSRCLLPLAKPSMLVTLDLSHNSFSSVPELSHLQCLTSLKLDHNQLKDLNGVQALNSLTTLSACSNALTDISVFQHSEAELRRLHLSHNHICGLEPLQQFRASLQELHLPHNDVLHLSPLAKFSTLMCLDVSANNIHQAESVKVLQTVPYLRSFSLTDNPLCYPLMSAMVPVDEEEDPREVVASDDPNQPPLVRPPRAEAHAPDVAGHQRSLRCKVIAWLPQLRELDGLAVSAEDKVKAKIEAMGDRP